MMAPIKQVSLRWTLTLVLAALTAPAWAQETLTGHVADEAGSPVSFANIQLLAATDSSLVQGTVGTKDGTFTLKAVDEGAYVLHVSLIGYQAATSDVLHLSGAGMRDVGVVTLRRKALEMGEVAVEARRTTYEQQADRLVINVGTSVTLAGQSALEVLKRSPGVIVNEQSGTISLVGKAGVRVLVNGKRSYVPTDGLIQFLAGISADNLQRIELITSPPAHLDAEGNAGFINIVLERSPAGGLSGSVTVSGGYGQGEVGNASATINYRRRRVRLYASYSGLLRGQLQYWNNDRRLVSSDGPVQTSTRSRRDPRRINHDTRVALDVEITDRTTIGGLVGAYDHRWTMDAVNRMQVRNGGTPRTRIRSDNDEINHWRHAMGNVYVHRALPGNASLRADLDYVYYHDNNPTNYLNTTTDIQTGQVVEERLESSKTTPLRIWVGKADYNRTWQEAGELAAGVKGAFSRFTNRAAYEGLVNEAWVANAGLTSESVLREDVLAAYGSANIPLSASASLKLGLRYELTDSRLRSDEEQNLVNRRFGTLFPSVSYSHDLTADAQIDASYTRRITRPSFSQIAPFLYFLDPFTFYTGNTALQAAIMNALKLNVSYRDLIASVEYTWEDSTISQFQNHILPEENVQLVFSKNLRQTRRATALITLPVHPTSWWSMQNNVTATWKALDGFRDGEAVSTTHASVLFNSTQNISLPHDFNFEASGYYQGATQLGFIQMDPRWKIDLGLQRTLPAGYGTVTLTVNNVVDSAEWAWSEENVGDAPRVESFIDFSHRTLQLTYSLRFGDGKASTERSTASADERGRVQSQ
jgi:hypothetical protein